MTRARVLPTVAKAAETSNRTVWKVTYPSGGNAYRATTYPNSELLYIDNWATSRPVSKITAHHMYAEVREAIAAYHPPRKDETA